MTFGFAGGRRLLLAGSGQSWTWLIAGAVAFAIPSAVGVLSVATADHAGAVVAQTITVRGNQRVDASTIRTYMTVKAGTNYGAADLDSSQKALFATGLFSDVSVVSANGGSADRNSCQDRQCDGVTRFHCFLLLTLMTGTKLKLKTSVASKIGHFGTSTPFPQFRITGLDCR